MKNILITGAGSYIGMCFENYIKEFSDYTVETLDMINPEWEKKDFSSFDAICNLLVFTPQISTLFIKIKIPFQKYVIYIISKRGKLYTFSPHKCFLLYFQILTLVFQEHFLYLQLQYQRLRRND